MYCLQASYKSLTPEHIRNSHAGISQSSGRKGIPGRTNPFGRIISGIFLYK